ncbi:hypothetical protein TNIN_129651 [Trichonephila inaurata madagascariensis]|uniref:Uncharacterized protein n=1 Tax=Trichonephila inaurata madagascariensis TaxID=2747483 RepID=A0A8X6YA51_9ARAC|nr:hypothetical protein TNIN_129651 [Trichonephila inaurata madagascariensis]
MDGIVNLGPRLPCSWCRALKWKDETQEMCCSGGGLASLTRSFEHYLKCPFFERCGKSFGSVEGEVLVVKDLSSNVGLEGSGSAKKKGFNLSIDHQSQIDLGHVWRLYISGTQCSLETMM